MKLFDYDEILIWKMKIPPAKETTLSIHSLPRP